MQVIVGSKLNSVERPLIELGQHLYQWNTPQTEKIPLALLATIRLRFLRIMIV